MAEEGKTSFQDLEAQPLPQSAHWMDSLIEEIGKLEERPLETSIFKVPNILRKVDEEAYSPRIVSIGPFHKNTTTTTISVLPQTVEHKEDHPQTLVKKHDHLLDMEEHKRWYIIYLLNQEGKKSTVEAKKILVQCGEAVKEDKRIRGRYAGNINLESHQLAEIMLYDGCFILELFLRSWCDEYRTMEDPIFRNAWMVPALRHDLALLENQIPFFILENLFEIFVPKNKGPASIIDLALTFFHPCLNLKKVEAIRERCKKFSQGNRPLHLLDLLHRLYLPTSRQAISKAKERPRFTKCATELLEAGIQFNKGKGRGEASTNAPLSSQSTQKNMEKGEEDHLLEISFSDGFITIPPLMRIDEKKKSLLRNLIAYEQCYGSAEQHITSYAILLQSLIQSPRDVQLFRQEKIITNDPSEVEDVLAFFKNISKEILPNDSCAGGVVPKDFYFGELRTDVEKYLRVCRWQRCRAFLTVQCRRYLVELMSKYFSSPWTFMSFIAAVVLLALTIVQTIDAVRS